MKRTLLLLALVLTSAAHAAVYKWTDAKGRVHFSDKPVPSAKKIEPNPPANAAQATTDVSAEQAASHARECQDKQEQLVTYKNAARVVERDSLGHEKEYSADEKQKLIQITEAQIAKYCGPQAAQESQPAPQPPPPQQQQTQSSTSIQMPPDPVDNGR